MNMDRNDPESKKRGTGSVPGACPTFFLPFFCCIHSLNRSNDNLLSRQMNSWSGRQRMSLDDVARRRGANSDIGEQFRIRGHAVACVFAVSPNG